MSAVRPDPIYLDHNATTPVLPEVVEAMRACWLEPHFNPSSQHQFGRRARRVLEDARDRIGELLRAEISGTHAEQVIFTSGGTESNNLAIRGLAHDGGHLIISAAEHPSIASLAEEMAHRGWQVDRLGVDERGVIRADRLPALLRSETKLVAAVLGQNETGVVQPVAQLATICAEHHVPLHTDAAQVAGKMPINFRALGATTMTIAAHKFHGPVGIGALVVRHGVELRPLLLGGFQQAGLRPGTESLALAVGMSRALELWNNERDVRAARMRELRDHFEQSILAGWPEAVVIGRDAVRLPHTSHIGFVGLDRQALFMALDQAGVACSTGSACASGSSEPSPVLLAMGCDPAVVTGALRFSLGATTTGRDIDEASRRILACCHDLRRRKAR